MKWPERVPPPPNDCEACNGTGQRHYAGQIGSEATPAEWLAALVECTREWVRVLKPEGSLFVNLGDKYASGDGSGNQAGLAPDGAYFNGGNRATRARGHARNRLEFGASRPKSLLGLPWRYALAATDQLGLILRRDIIWSKPNGLPESVTDRCRSSHEYVFHLTRQPRYYSAVDEIREPTHREGLTWAERKLVGRTPNPDAGHNYGGPGMAAHPLGKLPGSVWSIPSQPLTVPPALGVDHFAAFPMELPRRIVAGWSPAGVCTGCGQGRRSVWEDRGLSTYRQLKDAANLMLGRDVGPISEPGNSGNTKNGQGKPVTYVAKPKALTGYVCACPDTSAPTRPAIVLDPFGGTGTTALVASALGRHGISVDMSADYCRLAAWRCSDPGQRAAAMQVPKPPPVPDDQLELFA